MAKYNRDITELKTKAALWWPEELKEKNAKANVIPLLLSTQEEFLSILKLAKKDPFKVFDLISSAEFPANYFLKHLAVLADYGGEKIQRLGNEFKDIFPTNKSGKYYFEFTWNAKNYIYEFLEFPIKGMGNSKFKIDGDGLTKGCLLDNKAKDLIAILLFAAASDVYDKAELNLCEIGTLIGDPDKLEAYVRNKYIVVSRITGGATANSLGQLAQSEIVSFLTKELGDKYKIIRNGYISIDGYDKKGGMPFDLVVEKGKNKVGIEVSFQVTTNSTIERKAGQAADRQALVHKSGYHIAYVLDGAGNFQRSSAISTICNHSDCTVAYTLAEFKVLSNWIKSVL